MSEKKWYEPADNPPATDASSTAIAIVVILVVILLPTLIVASCTGGFSSSSYSSSSSKSKDSSIEFADAITTPGTPEYDWYHDEYLPEKRKEKYGY